MFFGIIRQAAGQNERPSMPTVLRLYNMLSIYSLIKPPKFGNCQTELGQEAPCLTLSDLTSAFKDDLQEETKLQQLRRRLDGYIGEELEWEEVFDHSYASCEVVDCIIYYVTGYMCRKLLKSTECHVCKRGLAVPFSHSQKPEAALVNCKTLGRLIQPTTSIFVLLRATEMEFQKHCKKRNAYELTLDNVLDSNWLSFPCPSHKDDIITKILHYYVALRMRQYCKQQKDKENKTNHLRKLSKLVRPN